jgi:hypothetical protein
MRNGLEKRLSRLEKHVAERTEKPSVCNCRVETRFHSAVCLNAVLKGMPRVCPVHGFRELGFFWWTPPKSTLRSEDNQFCPCPLHPWRSFVLSAGPHTWDAHNAALEAATEVQRDPILNLHEDNRRSMAIMEEYLAAREEWLDGSGRELPSRAELVKLQWKRAPARDDQKSRPSV